MSDVRPVRGGVYPYLGVRRGVFVVISADYLNTAGTVIVAEVTDHAPDDVRGLLAVQLGADDPLVGNWVLCWRINYANADRFDVAGCYGQLSDATMRSVVAGVRNAIEPLR